jgi:hypothetical protein
MSSSADDERLAGRLDEDQARLLAAVSPYGFELRQPRKRPFEDYELEAFEAPDTVLTRLSGEIDGVPVDIFEYDWVQPGAKGAVNRGRRIAILIRHPAIDGRARCTWETFQTLGAKIFYGALIAFVFATLFWLLIPIWLVQHYQGKSTFGRDWRVGDAEFDKRFKVDGPSHAEALRALPCAMQQLALAEELHGPIEVRPGILAMALTAKRFDPQTFERAYALAKRALAAYAPPPAQAGTAYRIATDVIPEPLDEAPESESAERKA